MTMTALGMYRMQAEDEEEEGLLVGRKGDGEGEEVEEEQTARRAPSETGPIWNRGEQRNMKNGWDTKVRREEAGKVERSLWQPVACVIFRRRSRNLARIASDAR